MNTYERLRTPGTVTYREESASVGATSGLEKRAEDLFARRQDMLHVVAEQLSQSLYEVLHEKITYEHRTLLAFAAAEAKERATKEKQRIILNPHYFQLKRLEVDFL